MSDLSSVWKRLEQSIALWASKEPTIVAAVIVGSRARRDPPADEWSDLDVMLFLNDPANLINRSDWIEEIGEPILAVPGRTVNNDPERLVIFSGGYNVDFVFLSARAIDWLGEHGTQMEPFGRGARVLIDKDGRIEKLFPPDQPPGKVRMNTPPTVEEFSRAVQAFWFSAYYTAKMLRRGDLWTARSTDHQLKETLSSLMTLHAMLVNQRDDVWFRGRFMKKWAEPQALAMIPDTFWGYDEREAWRALLTTIELFQKLSTEIATALNYPYPHETSTRMAELIRSLSPA